MLFGQADVNHIDQKRALVLLFAFVPSKEGEVDWAEVLSLAETFTACSRDQKGRG